MVSASESSKGFLIDGYPREVEQGIKFENTVNKINNYNYAVNKYHVYTLFLTV